MQQTEGQFGPSCHSLNNLSGQNLWILLVQLVALKFVALQLQVKWAIFGLGHPDLCFWDGFKTCSKFAFPDFNLLSSLVQSPVMERGSFMVLAYGLQPKNRRGYADKNTYILRELIYTARTFH